jgi:hypothetical protein
MNRNQLTVESGRIECLATLLRETFAQLPPHYHKALDNGEVIAAIARGHAGYATIGWRDPTNETDREFRESGMLDHAVALVTKELRGLTQLLNQKDESQANLTNWLAAVTQRHSDELAAVNQQHADDLAAVRAQYRAARLEYLAQVVALAEKLAALNDRLTSMESAHKPSTQPKAC